LKKLNNQKLAIQLALSYDLPGAEQLIQSKLDTAESEVDFDKSNKQSKSHKNLISRKPEVLSSNNELTPTKSVQKPEPS
jgi:hypothetical protein